MKPFLLCISLLAASACLFGPLANAQETLQPTPVASVQKWEYRVVRITTRVPATARSASSTRATQAEETLNRLGAEGWELVDIQIDGTKAYESPVFYFKRPK